MKPHVKTGLIVGAVGLVVNTIASALLGLCGPLVALIVGAIAGLLAVGRVQGPTKADSAKLAAVAAVIAGLMTAVGQFIGGFAVLIMAQQLEWQLPFGQVPGASSTAAESAGYWMGGLLAGGCFGTVGVILAVLAGAAAGYLRAKPQPQYAPQYQQPYVPMPYPVAPQTPAGVEPPVQPLAEQQPPAEV